MIGPWIEILYFEDRSLLGMSGAAGALPARPARTNVQPVSSRLIITDPYFEPGLQ
jgi:hypothetical protein